MKDGELVPTFLFGEQSPERLELSGENGAAQLQGIEVGVVFEKRLEHLAEHLAARVERTELGKKGDRRIFLGRNRSVSNAGRSVKNASVPSFAHRALLPRAARLVGREALMVGILVEWYRNLLPWYLMALNIKNPDVHALAAELAHLRKVSLTQAVLDAVRHELTREKARSRESGLGDQLLEIGKRCASHVVGQVSSADHATLLYDNRGLPHSGENAS